MIRYRFFGYMFLLLLSLIVLNFSFRTVSAITPLCGACHETRAHYAAWKESAHSGVACLGCHLDPGVAGYLSGPLRAAHALGVKLTGRQGRELPTDVNGDLCLRCHDRILDDTIVKKRIRIKHREIVDAGWRCRDCHADAGHKLPGRTDYDGFASMDKCLGCHNTDRLRRCSVCHTGKIGGGLDRKDKMGLLAHNERWGETHGLSDTRTCRACHEQEDFCRNCHEVAMPHPGNWPRLHGRSASARRGACGDCHSAKYCRDCHLLELPHPSDFDHGIEAKRERDTCDRCHTERSCKGCHDAHDTHLLKR